MDTKGLARSKRAHSQHHSKKSHSSHKAKAPSKSSGGPTSLNKLLGNQASEKSKNPVKSLGESGLASNWDRYEEETNSGLENSTSSSLPSDVILLKSKGADYRHLLDEAQAESQSKTNVSSDVLSSVDDLLHDEFRGLVGSMLLARGKGKVSWIGDDNFVTEDGSASGHEAAFISLNLNTLAEKLEKVDLHERLYIEADVLPRELHTAKSEADSNPEPCQPCIMQDAEAVAMTSEALHLEVTDEIIEPVVPRGYLVGGSLSPRLEPVAKDQVKDIELVSGGSEESSTKGLDLDQVGLSKKKSSAFEVTSAEAELDMLLNSFDEADAEEACKPPPVQNLATSTSSSMPKPPVASFDDVLDDLLEQTSGLVKPGDVVSQPKQNQASSSATSSSKPVGKSKLLDDFDSWLNTI